MYFMSFFFNDTATTEIYTLSLHDALPIFRTRIERLESESRRRQQARSALGAPEDRARELAAAVARGEAAAAALQADRKSTRLNSSHSQISYAVFCLKKKKNKETKSYNSKI